MFWIFTPYITEWLILNKHCLAWNRTTNMFSFSISPFQLDFCLLAEVVYFWNLQQPDPALSMSCFKIMFSALMTRFSISVLCVCLCICLSCACLVSVIKHYKCPLQYMLDESTPSNSARCNPPAHITVVNAQTFQQLAPVNVSLLSFNMPYPNI